MAATPVYAFRYPTLADQPHGPDQIKNLAEDVEAKFVTLDAATTALDTTSTTEATGGGTTSTTYVAVGATCGVVFTAPPSGKVTVHFGAAGFNSGANDNKTSVDVKTGGTIGSGTVVQAAVDNNMILIVGTNAFRGSSFTTVSGLTPGSIYNVQMMHKTNTGTTTALYRSISVVPQV